VAARNDIEVGRRLPESIVDAMARADLFGLFVPRSVGGLEVDPLTALDVVEELAQADGSAGWLAITNASGLFSAWLADAAARAIYSTPSTTIIAGALVPSGQAVSVSGGHCVSGRWAFVSGIEHCAWLVAGCKVVDTSGRTAPDGRPTVRAVFLPAAALEIVDTWSVSGLRGTGSHDVVAHDVFVPEEFSFAPSDPPVQSGPLYAVPVRCIGAAGLGAVALGIARSALQALAELAGSHSSTATPRLLQDRPMVHVQVAQAEAHVRSARAFLREAMAEMWASVNAGQAASAQQIASLRLAATHAASSAAQAVDLLWAAGGGSTVYIDSPLGRAFRDAHAATQHASIQSALYEPIGRALLGLSPAGAPAL
jgi:alkylation response protein AidB-like acyl-CoA dehydrogenase